jgi:hypothetical protein
LSDALAGGNAGRKNPRGYSRLELFLEKPLGLGVFGFFLLFGDGVTADSAAGDQKSRTARQRRARQKKKRYQQGIETQRIGFCFHGFSLRPIYHIWLGASIDFERGFGILAS